MEWPSLQHAGTTIPNDLGDPLAQAYLLSWPGHILPINPGQLWNANTFFPEHGSFAFTDSLIGYAPFSFIGDGPESALIRYNLIFVGVRALSFIGAYALVRQLGSNWLGAVLAGVAFAFAPWTYSHDGQLNIISTGGIPLALAALCRGHGFSLTHGFQRAKTRSGWVVTGWLVAAWQISLGFAIGLPFLYVILGLSVVVGAIVIVRWIKHRQSPLPTKLLIANAIGGAIFTAATLLMAAPRLSLIKRFPEETRSNPGEIRSYSPPWRGFFVAQGNSGFWGNRQTGAREQLLAGSGYKGIDEITLLPGFVLLILALAGVFFSIWRLWHRLILVVAVFVSAVLVMGVEIAGGRYSYLVLYHLLPGWDSLRTPGRLMLWSMLLLVILAAGFLSRVAQVLATRTRKAVIGVALLIPVFLVGVEGTSATAHPIVPTPPADIRNAQGPLLVLPSDYFYNTRVMLWTVGNFPNVVNGSSRLVPKRQSQVQQAAAKLPDASSVTYLRNLGIRTIMIVRKDIRGTPYERLLSLTAQQLPTSMTRVDTSQTVMFTLRPA